MVPPTSFLLRLGFQSILISQSFSIKKALLDTRVSHSQPATQESELPVMVPSWLNRVVG
jgi:hypothetical protein